MICVEGYKFALLSPAYSGEKKGCSVWIHNHLHKFQGCKSCAVTTLGRGGRDLTATSIGKALGLREVQVCFQCHRSLH